MVVYAPGRTSQYPEIPLSEDCVIIILGGNEVGNVGIVLEDHLQILAIGLWNSNQPPRYPNEAPHVSNAIITHSHIDLGYGAMARIKS